MLRKLFVLLGGMLTSMVVFGWAYAAPADHIIISEVQYNAGFGSTDNAYEWIELFNPTTGTINLSGWILEEKQGGPKNYQFSSGVIIGPSQYLLIVNSLTHFQNANPGINPSIIMNSQGVCTPSLTNIGGGVMVCLGLNNSSPRDRLYLKNSAGTTIDYVEWTLYGTHAAGTGNSLCRPASTDTDIAGDRQSNCTATPGSGNLSFMPYISLQGSGSITIEMGTIYNDSGAVYTDTRGTGLAIVSGNLNTGVVGVYTLEYIHTDLSGNIASSVFRTVTVVDTTAPVVTVDGPISGGVLSTGTPVITGTSESGALITVVISGVIYTGVADSSENYSISISPALVDGEYTADVTATDSEGNTSSVVSTTFTIDTTAPVVTVDGPISGGVLSTGTPVITGTSESGALITVVISGVIYTGVADSSGNYSISISPALVDGEYTADVTATDSEGNTSSVVSTTFTIDTTAPVVTVDGPISGGVLSTGTPVITGTSESGALITVVISGVIYTGVADSSGNYSISISPALVDGEYTADVTATDSEGNTSSVVSTTFTIDTTAPVVTLTGLSTVTITQGGSYTEVGAVWADGNLSGFILSAISGVVNTNVVGSYVLYYTYVDVAGNTGNVVMRTINVIAPSSTGPGGAGGYAGGGGSPILTKDNCPNGDYTNSYYDGQCGIPQNNNINTGDDVNYTGDIYTTSCTQADYKLSSFQTLKKIADKRQFIVCWLYTHKQTIFDNVPDFDYDRVVTREEASRMITHFVKDILGKEPIRSGEEQICSFKDIEKANSGLAYYIKESCRYGIFNGTYDHQFLPKQQLNQAHAIATVLRASYGYQDESGSVRFTPYIDMISTKSLTRKTFTKPNDLKVLERRGMTRGNLGELMYRVAIDLL